MIQLHITDNELITFFRNAGYGTIYKDVPQFRSVTHGIDEEYELSVLHVVDYDGFEVPAKEVFQDAMKLRLTTPDELTREAIKQVLNNGK